MKMWQTLATLVVVLVAPGCGGSAAGDSLSFDEEFSLSVRAGRDELTKEDRQALLNRNHPLLMQISDENTLKLVKLLATLPDESHDELLKQSYLKWEYSLLDEARQQVCRDIIQLNIDMAAKQGGQSQPGFSLAALEEAEVGFAVVEIPATDQKVVSWFVLWPELPNPTWITVVNGGAAGTQPYFQAHLQRLPLLKSMEGSTAPIAEEDADTGPGE
jgi:hypothetical protein